MMKNKTIYKSDELQSEEVEKGGRIYPMFNSDTDFNRKITFKAGLVFLKVEILRAFV